MELPEGVGPEYRVVSPVLALEGLLAAEDLAESALVVVLRGLPFLVLAAFAEFFPCLLEDVQAEDSDSESVVSKSAK